MRAIIGFIVQHKGIKLHVRVLPTVAAVTREWHNLAMQKAPTDGKRYIHAFTARPPRAKYSFITLAGNGNLDELVPHEVFHAVMYHMGSVSAEDDEAAACAVGILSAKILRRVRNDIV